MTADLYPDVITNSTSLLTMLQNVNSELVAGWLGNVIIITLFVILFVNLMRNNSNAEAFSTASFICTIVSILFFIIGIVTEYMMALMIFFTIAGIVAQYLSTRS